MICPNCKRETQPAFFCYACDVYMADLSLGTKAGVARRWAALFIDAVLIWVIFFLALGLSAKVGDAAGGPQQGMGAFVTTFFLAMIGYTVFSIWFLSQGKTLGKWIQGIRCVNKTNGGVPGLGRMIVRETVGKAVSGFFGLGYLSAVWDHDNQCWHDKIAGTLVLRETDAWRARGYSLSPRPTELGLGLTAPYSSNATFLEKTEPADVGRQGRFCEDCGTELEAGAKFCEACGARIS